MSVTLAQNKYILLTVKLHPYQPLFEATLDRRRGTCSNKTRLLFRKTKVQTKLYLANMCRSLRRSLVAKHWRRSFSLLARPEVESESRTQDENSWKKSRNKSEWVKKFPNRKPRTAKPIPFTSPRWPINRRQSYKERIRGGNKASNRVLQGRLLNF